MNRRNSRRSLQDVIRHRSQSGFVGREEQLQKFRWNLNNPVRDGETCYFPHLIFNVHGQGGVGKTTLVNQFRQVAKEVERPIATAYLDEGILDLPTAMAHLAKQLAHQGHDLKPLLDRYEDYRQKKQEIAADPDAPQGFSALLGRTVARTGLHMARQMPIGGGMVDEFVDAEVLTTQAGEWATYLAKRFKNKDDVQLVNEPEAVLTPLFVEGLWEVAEQADVLLFFDTYEQTGKFLDRWLRQLLADETNELPTNICWIVSGQNELDKNLWIGFDELIARLPLEPFTEVEAQQYLHRKGITDEAVIKEILALSGQLPLLVATLAVGNPMRPEQVCNPSDTAVDRFLKWVDNPQKRQLALDAALPRRLNRDVIAQLVPNEMADELFSWLKGMPFVQERSDGWGYHLVVRDLFLRHQRITSQRQWDQIHEKLANHYHQLLQNLDLNEKEKWKNEIWQKYRLEVLYHQLCAAPQEQFAKAINGVVEALKRKRSFANYWADTLLVAGKDGGVEDLRFWGEKLNNGLAAYEVDDYLSSIDMFNALLKDAPLEKLWQAVVLNRLGYLHRLQQNYSGSLKDLTAAINLNEKDGEFWFDRGFTYYLIKEYEEALSDFDKAIELNFNSSSTIAFRGAIYRLMKEYEKARADFDKAIELDPNNTFAIVLRGEMYQALNEQEKACADFDKAIELDSNDAFAITLRGQTYQTLDEHEKALADFDKVIELHPNYTFAIGLRGSMYRLIEEHKKALLDFDKMINLDPNYAWAIASRGETYRLMEEHEKSLADFDKAIELDPNYAWAIASRGETYHALKEYEKALADFDKAIKLDPESAWMITLRGVMYQALKEYEKALADFDKAIELDPNYAWALTSRGEAYQALKEYEKSLLDFNKVIELDPNSAWIITSRGEIYHALKEYNKALLDFDKAIGFFPNHAWIIASRGTVHRSLSKYSEALADFDKAIDLDSRNDWYYYERALLYVLLAQNNQAQNNFSAAINLVKSSHEKKLLDWQNTFNLAIYHLAAGKTQESAALYKEACSNGATFLLIQEAINDLEDFLALFPDHKTAAAAIKFLKAQCDVVSNKPLN